MIYRTDDKLKTKTSLLGFGGMRFPVDADDKIDEAQTTKMIDMAIEAGVNYFDTAYSYHNEQSESFYGKALVGRHDRSSFYLADKLPLWFTTDMQKTQEIFEEQMRRLQTDYVDFHLLHAMNKERFDQAKEIGIIDWQEDKKKEGVFTHVGFSFHDKPEVLDEILSYKHWDFCQIQLNYLDWDIYQSKEMYDIARKHGVPLIIMEPIRGGSLSNPNDKVRELFKEVRPDLTPSAIALSFVANLDGILTILSGMSNLQHVQENIVTISQFQGLTKEEEVMYEKAREIFRSLPLIPCTSCKYCSECPMDIEMWELFNKYNHYISYNDPKPLVNYVKKHDPAHLPPACIKCYTCENLCPQHIEITEEIQKVYALAESLM